MSGLSSSDSTPIKKAKRVAGNKSKWSKHLQFSEDEKVDWGLSHFLWYCDTINYNTLIIILYKFQLNMLTCALQGAN